MDKEEELKEDKVTKDGLNRDPGNVTDYQKELLELASSRIVKDPSLEQISNRAQGNDEEAQEVDGAFGYESENGTNSSLSDSELEMNFVVPTDDDLSSDSDRKNRRKRKRSTDKKRSAKMPRTCRSTKYANQNPSTSSFLSKKKSSTWSSASNDSEHDKSNYMGETEDTDDSDSTV